MLRRLRDLAAFLTLLPLSTDRGSLDRAASSTGLMPLVGWLTGGVAAVAALLASQVSPLTGGVAAVAAAILFSRALHFDGLTDTADALLCHGTRDRKRTALKDHDTGAGGIAAALATYGLTVAALAATPHIAALVLLSEIAAKLGVVTTITTSRPLGDGLGARHIRNTPTHHLVLAAALAAPALLLAPPVAALAALGAGVVAALLVARIAHRSLGGSNGDVMGAANEVARAAAALAGAYVLGVSTGALTL